MEKHWFEAVAWGKARISLANALDGCNLLAFAIVLAAVAVFYFGSEMFLPAFAEQPPVPMVDTVAMQTPANSYYRSMSESMSVTATHGGGSNLPTSYQRVMTESMSVTTFQGKAPNSFVRSVAEQASMTSGMPASSPPPVSQPARASPAPYSASSNQRIDERINPASKMLGKKSDAAKNTIGRTPYQATEFISSIDAGPPDKYSETDELSGPDGDPDDSNVVLEYLDDYIRMQQSMHNAALLNVSISAVFLVGAISIVVSKRTSATTSRLQRKIRAVLLINHDYNIEDPIPKRTDDVPSARSLLLVITVFVVPPMTFSIGQSHAQEYDEPDKAVVEILSASHLDSNKMVIADITEESRKLDGLWSEEVSEGQYVRVTFEQNLTSARDISLYVRVVSGEPRIEIYEKDGTEIIAGFANLDSDAYNKVFLTNLQGSQDTFDLKILDGSVEFDQIVDPYPVPTYVGAGTVAAGTGSISPALPAGIQTNDILLLFVETANSEVTINNQNGGTWTEVANSPQGIAGFLQPTRLSVFWSRYNGSQGAPTTNNSGNHMIGVILAFRGVTTTGNPWDVTSGTTASASTSASIPGATTTATNTLVVMAVATHVPNADGSNNFSGWTNANLANIVERIDVTRTAGNGGGLGIATGEKATAGTYGNTAVTLGQSATKGMMTIALRPPPPVPPTLSISQPDGTNDTVVRGDPYSLTYTLSDPDDVTTAAFFYDTNNSGLDGTPIPGACATAPEGTNVTCQLDTTRMPPGSYYIYGVANDGVNPAVSAYSPGQITIGNQFYIFVGQEEDNSVVDTIAVGDMPFAIGINSDTNRVYAANWFTSSVAVIDGSTGSIVGNVTVGVTPSGAAVNRATNRIYITNLFDNSVSVIDGDTDTVISTIAVGGGPVGVAVDEAANRIYVASLFGNSVSVINGNTNTVIGAIAVGTGSYGMAFNPETNRIYVANRDSDDVSVIDANTNTVLATVTVGDAPLGITVNPFTNLIYVANSGSGNVSVIDGDTNTVTDTITVGSVPEGIAVNPATNRIFVANGGSGNVSVIDGSNGMVIDTITADSGSRWLDVNPVTNLVYVANIDVDNLSVISNTYADIMAVTDTIATSKNTVVLLSEQAGLEDRIHRSLNGYSAGTVYRSDTGEFGLNSVKYRQWDPTAGIWSPEVELPDTGSPITDVRMAFSPVSEMRVVVSHSEDGTLNLFRCDMVCIDPASWTLVAADFADTGPENGPGPSRFFDIAFQQQSGKLLVVYDRDDGQAVDFYYRTYDGVTLSTESGHNYIGNEFLADREVIPFIRLAPKPGSDEIAMVLQDFTRQDAYAFIFDAATGTPSAATQVTLASNMGTTSIHGEVIGIAYEQGSGNAVAFAANNVDSMSYSVWDGTEWSSVSTVDPNPAASSHIKFMSVKANPSPTSNAIVICQVDDQLDLTCAEMSNGVLGSFTVIDSDVDSMTTRPFDFVWIPGTDTGILVYGTESGEANWQVWSEGAWNPSPSATFAGTHPWIVGHEAPSASDATGALLLAMSSDLGIGSLAFSLANKTTLVTLGNATHTIDADTSVTEGMAIDWQFAGVRQPFRLPADALAVTDSIRISVAKAMTETMAIVDALKPAFPKAIAENLAVADAISIAAAKSISEQIGVTETIAKAIPKDLSENLGLTETIARTLVGARSISEPLAVGDMIVKSDSRALTEQLAVSDSIDGSSAISESISEQMTTTDAITRTVAKTISEQAELTDAVQRSVEQSRPIQEQLAIADSLDIAASKSLSEQLGAGDAISRSIEAHRSISEELDISELLTKAVEVELAEQLSATEAVDRSIATTRSTNESLTLTDSISAFSEKELADTMALSETVARAITPLRSVSEQLDVSDAISTAASKTLAEQFAVSDVTGRSIVVTRAISEIMGMTDELTKAALVAMNEQMAVTDAAARTILVSRTMSEGLSLAETSSSISTTKPVSEQLTITDKVTVTSMLARSMVEQLGMDESITASVVKTMSEDLQMTDEIQRLVVISRSLTEVMGVNDILSKAASVTIREEMDMSDTLSQSSLVLTRGVDDQLAVTDAVTMSIAKAATSEQLQVTDDVQRFITVARTLTESMAVTDAVAKQVSITAFAEQMGISDVVSRSAVQSITLMEQFGLTDSIAKSVAVILTEQMEMT
ncbi:MAG TPA: YncE family protein, partial [Nitrososphaera sp.]